MGILYDLLAGISKHLVYGTLNHIQYSFCFNDFVKELENVEANFIGTRRDVEYYVTYVRRQPLNIVEVIDKWLENANIDVKEVNCLLKEAKGKRSYCFWYCPNWIWRYRLGKKLANKKMDLQNIIQEGKQYIQLERTASIPSNTLDILTEKRRNFENFESRKFVSDKLMEALKDDGVVMIGLYGMGGCGKTTLAMEIKKMAEDEHLFDKIIFVLVSSVVEVSRIQEKIASSLQYTFPENEEMERAQWLCMRLTQEKNILMILDDVWEKLDFGRIGIPSSEHHKGCKILITTRSREVCTSMDCQIKIYLSILTSEEAWTLFQNKALISEDTPEIIKQLAKLISNECKGLPVAIVAVASSLKGKDKLIWGLTLSRFRGSKLINIIKGLQDPYTCLQLSYDNLDSEEAKSLFLLCSVFPEDYEIPVECLIRCAIGLGVAGEVHSYENARSEVMAAKIKLVSSCLILDADYESVKMHDLVRDVAQRIAKNENNIIKCEMEKDGSLEQSSIRYLWCVKFPNDMSCSNLEFLYIQAKLEISDGIFERMGKLRVLIIMNQSKNYRLQLSTRSFNTLTELRCLVLQYLKLNDLSFVSDMKKLQSLSLHGCSWPAFIDMQSDVAFTQLKNLKLIEFNRCDIEIKNLEEIKRIPLLEELYIIQTDWKYKDRRFIECFNLFSCIQTLQRYGIVLGEVFYPTYLPSEFISCQGTLLVNYFNISNEVKGLEKEAKELFVGNIEGGVKNMMSDIFEIEGGMNELSELGIMNSKEIEYLVDTGNDLSKVGNLISKLHFLSIQNMEHLRTLWHVCLPANGHFEKLEKLYLINCPQLTSLFTYVIAGGLVQLKILHIVNCNILEHIIDDEDKFTTGVQSKIFQNLEEVVVDGCGELKHIFSASIIGGLAQLKSLEIGHCDMLEQIMVNHISGSFTLSRLEMLRIVWCPRLGSVFPTSVAKSMTSLKTFIIRDCHDLKHIVTPDFQTHHPLIILLYVKMLTINQCELLQDIIPESLIIGEYPLQKDYTEINMYSSTLEVLELLNLPNLVSIYDTNSLSISALQNAPGIQNHFLTLQTLSLSNVEVKDVFCLNGPKLKLQIEDLNLINLCQITHITFVTNNSFIQHLKSIQIMGCEKLEAIFPQSVCLPELISLEVRECKELMMIVYEDFEDKKLSNLSPQPCFPKLAKLVIEQCHKLTCFVSECASECLPNLEVLVIIGANKLEKFIGYEIENIKLPELKLVIFMYLPKFHQETIFLDVGHRIVENCPELSLTSTTNSLGSLQAILQNFSDPDFKNSRISRSELISLYRRYTYYR